jgi:hypothetical protein
MSMQPAERPQFTGGIMFDWEDGKPQPKFSRSMAREQSQQVYHATSGAPYRGIWNSAQQRYVIEPGFEGLTIQEAITLKHAMNALSGDQTAINAWQDRILGKPKQALEVAQLAMSFTDYLTLLAEEDEKENREKNLAVDVEAREVARGKPEITDTRTELQKLLDEIGDDV